MSATDLVTILALGVVVCVAGYGLLGDGRRKPSNEVIDPNSQQRSAFNRLRLPRDNPHLWADQIEDWYVRVKSHIYFLYTLIGALIAVLFIHLIAH